MIKDTKHESPSGSHSDVTLACPLCSRVYFSETKLKEHFTECRKAGHATNSIEYRGTTEDELIKSEGEPVNASGANDANIYHGGENDVKEMGQKNSPPSHPSPGNTRGQRPMHSCPVCRQVIGNEKALNIHLRRHVADPVCALCQKRFHSLKNLKRLVKSRHTEEFYQTRKCPICGTTSDSERSLNMHMYKHIAEPVCYLCKKSCYDMKTLTQHVRSVHQQELYEMKPEHATAQLVRVAFYLLLTDSLCVESLIPLKVLRRSDLMICIDQY